MTKSLKGYKCRLCPQKTGRCGRTDVLLVLQHSRDPNTPDQIVMEQHSLAHFPTQPWCKMCVESRGRDSPHREQSKIDAVVPQLQFDFGYMGDLSRSRASSWEQTPLLKPSTRRWYHTRRRWTCPVLLPQLKCGDVTWGIHSTQKINDISYNQLISDPSMYVKKRAQRSDDSTLLRHMVDVVGTGPAEHLTSDFEHMTTSLYLTDVVVLRHEGDTVNFLGLEITKTSRCFKVKNSIHLVDSLLNLQGVENSKPTANLVLTLDSYGARVSNSTGWSRLLELSHSRLKTHLHGKLETRHTLCHPTNNHTNPQPHDREQARGETVDTISQRHATHLSSS